MSAIPYVVDTSRSPHARLRAVPINAVQLTDDFIEPRRKTNRLVTIPSQYDYLETTNRLRNFRRVIDNTPEIPFEGIFFNDSDVYKWLEAASSALADPALENRAQVEQQIETAVALIEKAQSPDGYLNTYFSFEREAERYTNLKDMHELYCMGHFVQAAVAHYRATSSERLLNVARRVADHLDATFGPAETGKREGTCGHEEIELALAELYRATGEERYLRLAEYFVNARGQRPSAAYRMGHPDDDGRYRQDHVPYRQMDEVTGHAVRMLYLTTGATDIALETGEAALLDAIHTQWKNMVERRSYVSGGVGSRWEGEAFGKDYELPADRAYTETCAAIASVMWNHRLLLLTGDSKYADLMEHTLYNAVLPGLSLSGDEYFYQNPLENDGTHRRQKWFGCACCPPNVARLLAQLPGYFYATDDSGNIYIHLYAAGTATITTPKGETVSIQISTDYPNSEKILIYVTGEGEPFDLYLRIPSWAQGAAVGLERDTWPVAAGKMYSMTVYPDMNSVVSVHLPMPVRQVVAHPYVGDAGDRSAILRGPLLYCAEATDNPFIDVRDIAIPSHAEWQTDSINALPGVTSIKTVGSTIDTLSNDTLYPARTDSAVDPKTSEVTLTPYFAWANREPGQMRVWLRQG